MIYDRSWLETEFRAKRHKTFAFFWGHQPSRDGSITAACFSQWWPSPFTSAGRIYPTAEHWMMAGKARLFGDEETAENIRAASSPREVKELGRQARGFDETRWNEAKRGIVVEGNFEKFRQNPPLGEFLLSTGEAIIVEASPVDRVWGTGLAVDGERATNPTLWRGANLLGFALMEVRDRLERQ